MVNAGEPQGSSHSVDIRGKTLAWRQGSASATKEIVYGSYNYPRPPIVEEVPSDQSNMPPIATSDPYRLDEPDPILTEMADRGGSSIPIGHPLKEQETI